MPQRLPHLYTVIAFIYIGKVAFDDYLHLVAELELADGAAFSRVCLILDTERVPPLSSEYIDGWLDGWMDGWMDG